MITILMLSNGQNELEYDLKQLNYELCLVEDKKIALELLNNNYYDFILIDEQVLNDFSYNLIKQIRTINLTSKIVVLSEITDELNIINCFEAGANDYFNKPFSTRVLIAKIRAYNRDFSANEKRKPSFQIKDDLIIDYDKREVYKENKIVSLTKTEYDLLCFLLANRDTVLNRELIMQQIWQYDYDKNNRVVDVYIHSLKKKLDLNKEIENKRGVGYIFTL